MPIREKNLARAVVLNQHDHQNQKHAEHDQGDGGGNAEQEICGDSQYGQRGKQSDIMFQGSHSGSFVGEKWVCKTR
jgi:hypothetical protein